jgi:hypothetical protein
VRRQPNLEALLVPRQVVQVSQTTLTLPEAAPRRAEDLACKMERVAC